MFRRVVSVALSVTLAVGLGAVVAPPASAGLYENTVKGGGAFSSEASLRAYEPQTTSYVGGCDVTDPNCEAYDPYAPVLVGSDEVTMWVDAQSSWSLTTGSGAEYCSLALACTTLYGNGFDDLKASAGYSTPTAYPTGSLTYGGGHAVWVGRGWQLHQQKQPMVLFTGLYADPETGETSAQPLEGYEQVFEPYERSILSHQWWRGIKTINGWEAAPRQCLQASIYTLDGPFDQSWEPIPSKDEGGTNVRVDEDGNYTNEGKPTETISVPLGKTMKNEYGWDWETLKTEPAPAYDTYHECLAYPDSLKQTVDEEEDIETLVSRGRYRQDGTSYVNNVDAWQFTAVPGRESLISYLYPSIASQTRLPGDLQIAGYFPYGTIGNIYATWVSDQTMEADPFTNYYAAFCYGNTGSETLFVAVADNGNYKNGFSYRDAEGNPIPRNLWGDRPDGEGNSDTFYSFDCAKGSSDGLRTGDILTCKDYKVLEAKQFSYNYAPYEYDRRSLKYDTQALEYEEAPVGWEDLNPVFQARPTRQSWEKTGTRQETYQSGTETYISGYWTEHYYTTDWGPATYYNPPGAWLCPAGWSISGTMCQTQTLRYIDHPIYSTRPTYATRTVDVYGYVTRPDACPAGTFVHSDSQCTVADEIPLVYFYSLALEQYECGNCTDGIINYTSDIYYYMTPPSGYALTDPNGTQTRGTGATYTRTTSDAGRIPVCEEGWEIRYSPWNCVRQKPIPDGWTGSTNFSYKIADAPEGYTLDGDAYKADVHNPPPAGWTDNTALGMYQKLDESPLSEGWEMKDNQWKRIVSANILVQGQDGTWRTAAPVEDAVDVRTGAERWLTALDGNRLWDANATGDWSRFLWQKPGMTLTADGRDVNDVADPDTIRWRYKLELDPASSPMYTGNPNADGLDNPYSVFLDGTPDTDTDTPAVGWDSGAGFPHVELDAWSPWMSSAGMENALRALYINAYTPTRQGKTGWKVTPWVEFQGEVPVTKSDLMTGVLMSDSAAFATGAQYYTDEVTEMVLNNYQCPMEPLTINFNGFAS